MGDKGYTRLGTKKNICTGIVHVYVMEVETTRQWMEH
jgi:hypothetical protein